MGEIRRGHVEAIRAAIWLSDMRGFTALAERLPPQELVDLLNRYFDCQVPADSRPWRRGAQVHGRRAAGDFPARPERASGTPARSAPRARLRARGARPTSRRSTAPAARERDTIRFGLALHVGQVMYGNIGGGNRLDFTCIGPAVNLAARLEKVAAQMGQSIVASAAVRRTCARAVHAAAANSPWRALRRRRRCSCLTAAAAIIEPPSIMSADDYIRSFPIRPTPRSPGRRRARMPRRAPRTTRARRACSANWEKMLNGPFRGITTDGEVIPDLFAPRPEDAPTLAMIEATNALLAMMSPEQRKTSCFPVGSDQWRRWQNTELYRRALRAAPRRDRRAAARRACWRCCAPA